MGVGDLCKPKLATPFPGYRDHLAEDAPTVAELLAEHGYRTSMSGKWHLGGERVDESGEPKDGERSKWPMERGFDAFFGLVHGKTGYFRPHSDRPFRLGEERFRTPEGFYATDGITDFAVRWLRESREGGRKDPIFLYVAYTAPHLPLEAPPPLIEKYRERYADLDVREAMRARSDRLVAAGTIPEEWTPRLDVDDEVRRDHERWVETEATVAAMTEAYDRGVGRIVDTLADLGELDDTLILFLSDNGAAAWHQELGNAPFSGRKGLLDEGGLVTHCIAHWPGVVPAESLVEARAHVVDVLPTLLETAGAGPPDGASLDGTSFLPALRGEGWRRPGPMFFEYHGARAMIDGDWKLFVDREGEIHLFDLARDGCETRDLAAAHDDRVGAMLAALEEWAERNGVLPFEVVERARARGSAREEDD